MNKSNQAIIDLLDSLSEVDYEEIVAEMKRDEVPTPASNKRWAAGMSNQYYYVHSEEGRVCTTYEHAHKEDLHHYATGNYYKTFELAKHALDIRLAEQRIFDALREHEGDWDGDWDDTTKAKHSIEYDHDTQEFGIDSSARYQYNKKESYSSPAACKWVIENMKNDLELVFGVGDKS